MVPNTEKQKAPTELQVMKSLKKLDYKYVVQFEIISNGGLAKDDFGAPIAFKSSDQVGPFMREEKLDMRWTKHIDVYISELSLATALQGE